MPNPRTGTVSDDLAKAVNNTKTGQVRFRNDKAGTIHTSIGRISFSESQLTENLQALMAELQKVKPAAVKGVYIRKVALSSTMGPSFNVTQEATA